jgi:hypothetical protein
VRFGSQCQVFNHKFVNTIEGSLLHISVWLSTPYQQSDVETHLSDLHAVIIQPVPSSRSAGGWTLKPDFGPCTHGAPRQSVLRSDVTLSLLLANWSYVWLVALGLLHIFP